MNTLRELAHSIYDHLIENFPADRNYPRTAFEQESMPWLVSHFLMQTMQRAVDLEIENLRESRSDWFDYDKPELQNAQRALEAALAAHVHIPRDEWAEKLDRAVHEVTSYLVRPTQTLVDFVFQEENGPLPVSIIQRRMAYFGAYTYLREVVRAYTEQKGIRELDQSRFETLLTQSDHRMTSDYGPEEWLRLLGPLFEFTGLVQRNSTPGIPVEILMAFFEEKGAESVGHRIRIFYQQNGSTFIDEQGLRSILEAIKEDRGQKEVFKPEVEKPQVKPLAPSAPPVQSEAIPRAVPLWQQFQRGASQKSPVGRSEPASRPAPSSLPRRNAVPDHPAPEATSVPLWMQYSKAREPEKTRTDPSPQGPEKSRSDLYARERSVLGIMGPRNREMFIENLFSGNAKEYLRVLALLDNASSWSEASKIIAEEVFRKHQVNIYSEPAVTFTNALEAKFRK